MALSQAMKRYGASRQKTRWPLALLQSADPKRPVVRRTSTPTVPDRGINPDRPLGTEQAGPLRHEQPVQLRYE